MDEYWEAAKRLSRKIDDAMYDNPAAMKKAFQAELEQVLKEKTAASGNDTDSGTKKN